MYNDSLPFDAQPWRLSGVVYGTALNDGAALGALGSVAHQPPYKAPPAAPVLYLKPRNTLAGDGALVELPAEADAFELGAALGLVIGRTACRVPESQAMAHLAGYTLVADLHLPHDSFYRPSVRFKARDGSCLIGPRVVAAGRLPDPATLSLRVLVDGHCVQCAGQEGMLRPAARLLAEVSAFMTLRPGDLLMLGLAHGAPLVRAGQQFAIEADGLGRLSGSLAAASLVAAS